MSKKITNEIVDQRLTNKNIKRADNYINMHVKIRWQCLNCNHIWGAVPCNILINHTSCPKCSNHLKLTNEIIDIKIVGRNIKRIDDCCGTGIKICWQCLNCNYIWSAKPDHILNAGSGCPSCANILILTNVIVDERLKERNINRLSNYINNNTLLDWKCSICNHIWAATPDSVLNKRKTGCPKCNLPGTNEKLLNYIFKNNNLQYEFQYCLRKIDATAPRYLFDIYFVELKLAIEYNGKQHYEPTGFKTTNKKIINELFVDQKKRDLYKRDFCRAKDIELIEIDGRHLHGKKLYNFLTSTLLPYIKSKYNEI